MNATTITLTVGSFKRESDYTSLFPLKRKMFDLNSISKLFPWYKISCSLQYIKIASLLTQHRRRNHE